MTTIAEFITKNELDKYQIAALKEQEDALNADLRLGAYLTVSGYDIYLNAEDVEDFPELTTPFSPNGDEYTPVFSFPCRAQIIDALRRYDEGFTGDSVDTFSDDQLYQKLETINSEYTAEELILSLTEGF